MGNMKVLIGCEESQVVANEFRKIGHEAYSCDIEPTRGNPEWHYKQDIMDVIPLKEWDLIILHPDCSAMSLSGNRWYGNGMKYNDKRKEQIEWTIKLWKLAKKHGASVALENPTSVIFKHLRSLGAKVFFLQPHEHGHGETKKTGFALHNLEPLKPTNIVDGRKQRIWKMAPSPTRKRDRSETYLGVAKAMADQW